jgi:hypothetical protein
MLAPRHFATMLGQMAIDAPLARLEREALIEAAPAIAAIMGRPHVAAPAPAPVVMPKPAPPPAPLPVTRPVATDGLRQRLGLH